LSILVLDRILRELGVSLTKFKKNELYFELSRAFGFIGSYRECDKLEEMWSDPIYKEVIKKHIDSWLSFR
jgi:hypothetical protein